MHLLKVLRQSTAHRCITSSTTRGFASSDSTKLTHIDDQGNAIMVNVGMKPITRRRAVATGKVFINDVAVTLIASGTSKKGDVLGVAQLAGIMAAKQTSLLIPLCHNISLSSIKVYLTCDSLYSDSTPQSISQHTGVVRIRAECETASQTGVEMEALTAVSVAGLTVYDMIKAVCKDCVIGEIQLLEKSGGQSGNFERSAII